MLTSDELQEILNISLRNGGDLAEIFIEETTSTSIAFEDDKAEKINSGTDIGAGIRLIDKKEIYYAATTDISFPSLKETAIKISSSIKKSKKTKTSDELIPQISERLGKIKKPVLLKRGMSATIEELLMAAEYIMSEGNHNVILCERGIRTFNTYTRNTLDLAIVPVLKKLTHLPIVVDPSHGTGKYDLVIPMSRAAVAAGCDGLIIECHTEPEKSVSDADQTISTKRFAKMMDELRLIAKAVGRTI